MIRDHALQVVVCAGGLGTRIAGWARYIPKEFYPVGGRPAIVHLLEEITQAGPADIVIVCHPYYQAFTQWASTALSQPGHDRYDRAAGGLHHPARTLRRPHLGPERRRPPRRSRRPVRRVR